MKQIPTTWKSFKQSWQWLFWAGPVLVVIGLSAGAVSGNWGSIPVGLTVAGIVLIGVWLLLQSQPGSGFWGRRSTQASTNALLSTLAVIVILGLINFLGVRYANQVDLTENQLYTLAPQSQGILRRLPQPVKVWVFMDPNSPNPNSGPTQALLDQYKRQSRQFNFEMVDPQAQPGLAQSFGIQDIGDVYIEAGQKRRFLQNLKSERLSEGRLTNAIEQITSDRQAKIYFLQGHGESSLDGGQRGLAQAKALLQEKNFISEPLNLVEQPAVPEDAAAVVVAGPKQALFDKEVRELSAYLQQGGSVLLMIDPNVDPKLEGLLKNWGVTLGNRIAINASAQQIAELGPTASVVNQYGDHPITKDFGNRYSIYPIARPIQTTPVSGVQETPLLVTSPQSWAESDLKNQNLEFNPERDRQGPLVLGVALSKAAQATGSAQASPSPSPSASPSVSSSASPSPSPSPTPTTEANKTLSESRLVVVGNSSFATDGLFGQQLNGDVFLNSVSWLSKRDDQVLSIRPKEDKNRRITMTAQQANLVGWLSLAVLPLLGFGTAGVMWWRRR
ncbi:Gldg family protein [Trichocoleus sp. FACHB-591]|uniref:GldG family protein n=1 Tax=Trichocoleus sp. FACHB-591 TaxID=2692872 RepID=UPI001688D598|nr:Gldg family protein [Trichocoleus sp. FACHB-591]MBD2093952.1 Gldg family protein [Trichocoleus sp. FACHB-591]